MMELTPVTISVTKKDRGLQIKGKINVGVQPMFSVSANFPVSLPLTSPTPGLIFSLCVICLGDKV